MINKKRLMMNNQAEICNHPERLMVNHQAKICKHSKACCLENHVVSQKSNSEAFQF